MEVRRLLSRPGWVSSKSLRGRFAWPRARRVQRMAATGGEEQGVEMGRTGHGQAGAVEELTRRRPSVAPSVMTDDVLPAPEAWERRHRHEQQAAGLDEPSGFAEAGGVVIEVLEHV